MKKWFFFLFAAFILSSCVKGEQTMLNGDAFCDLGGMFMVCMEERCLTHTPEEVADAYEKCLNLNK